MCDTRFSFTGTLLTLWHICQDSAAPVRFFRYDGERMRWIG